MNRISDCQADAQPKPGFFQKTELNTQSLRLHIDKYRDLEMASHYLRLFARDLKLALSRLYWTRRHLQQWLRMTTMYHTQLLVLKAGGLSRRGWLSRQQSDTQIQPASIAKNEQSQQIDNQRNIN